MDLSLLIETTSLQALPHPFFSLKVGKIVGLIEGFCVGRGVGLIVGSAVGAAVGLLEGSAVGAAVGLIDGTAVGATVGGGGQRECALGDEGPLRSFETVNLLEFITHTFLKWAGTRRRRRSGDARVQVRQAGHHRRRVARRDAARLQVFIVENLQVRNTIDLLLP